MSQISRPEAMDLVEKLFSESTPVSALFACPSGARFRLQGFVDGARRETGILLSTVRPATKADAYWLVPIFIGETERPCEYTFGDRRELPPEVAEGMTSEFPDAVLGMRFLDTGEWLCLFFTL